MCPTKGSRPGELSLKDTLMLKTEVATGDIEYDQLKELIMSHFHAKWGSQSNGINHVEPAPLLLNQPSSSSMANCFDWSLSRVKEFRSKLVSLA